MDSIQRKDGKRTYKQLSFNYSVYGNNKKFSGNATITIHQGSFTEMPTLTLALYYKTLEEAEAAIIKNVENWIDNHFIM